MRVKDFFELAKRVAISKLDKRNHLLAAIATRSDGAIVWSPNGPTPTPNGLVHAEQKTLRKCDYGATMYVVRIRKIDGSLALSKPCGKCLSAMHAKRVKRCFYSINDNEYGVIVP